MKIIFHELIIFKNNKDVSKTLFKLTLKCIVISILFFLTITVTAQTVSTDYQTQINSTFAGVDKSKIPHKLLIDYAMEFTELSAYNGILTSVNLTHRGHFTDIYNTLLMARVQTGVAGLVNPTTFRTNWDNLRQPNKIVLSGLYYKYNKFKDNASPNYITISNNKLYDKYVNGVWQNPYEEQQVFAVATPILKYNSLSVDVELPTTLWYTNQSTAVQSIAINFGDGNGYQTISFGQTQKITYIQAGVYEWKYKLTLTNNQVLYSHSKIQVEGIAPAPPLALRLPNEPCTNAFGIDEVQFTGTRTYLGQAGTATLEIDYALNDCTIRKPLIVVEGFDSGLLGVENPLGESFLQTFLTEALFDTGSLGGEITNYDIIYVNWDNGNDYLQRNAQLLKDIIDWVNAQKANAGSTTPNVVLGQSMGGVIARYALRDMELNNETHDTSLYISHNAPHQGANIPLSIQYFARHIVDQFVSTPLGDININVSGVGGAVTIEDIKTLLDAPGTKQLLKNSVASNFAIDNTMHDAWQSELESKGYPQQTRNVAISNGNHCANPQGFNPGDELFVLSGDAKTGILTDFLSVLFAPWNAVAFVSLADLFNEPALLIGIIPGNSKFNIDFKAKALPTVGSTIQIYKGKITFTKKILFIINLTLNITDRSFNNPSGILSFDYYLGGFFDVFFDFQNTSVNNIFVSLNITANIADSFNFIPTPSALDIGKGSVALNNNDYFIKYNAANPPSVPKNTPFDNFTTSYQPNSNLNEEHISFNTRNGDWLATELDDVANNSEIFDCSFVCDGATATISGNSTLCASNIYSVNVSGDAVVNWSVSNTSAASLSSPTGASVTVTTPTNGFRTNITLTAIISSSKCGSSITLTKNIRIGKPDTPSSINGPALVNTGALVSYRAGVSTGATSYAWYLPYPYTTVSTFDYSGLNWQLQAPGNTAIAQTFTGFAKNAGYVQVMGENACGKGGAKLLYVQHQSSGGGLPGGGGIASVGSTDNVKEVSLYPNPAKNKVTVSLTRLTEYESEPPTVIYGIKIMDLSLIERKFYQFRKFKSQETINVGFLETGLYSLIVYTDTATFTKMLLIR